MEARQAPPPACAASSAALPHPAAAAAAAHDAASSSLSSEGRRSSSSKGPQRARAGKQKQTAAAPRRPLKYWQAFNTWWRQQFGLTDPPQRPTREQINRWYGAHADASWAAGDKPSLAETRAHAKCLRDTAGVRQYFRDYRKRRASSCEDDEGDWGSADAGGGAGCSPPQQKRPRGKAVSGGSIRARGSRDSASRDAGGTAGQQLQHAAATAAPCDTSGGFTSNELAAWHASYAAAAAAGGGDAMWPGAAGAAPGAWPAHMSFLDAATAAEAGGPAGSHALPAGQHPSQPGSIQLDAPAVSVHALAALTAHETAAAASPPQQSGQHNRHHPGAAAAAALPAAALVQVLPHVPGSSLPPVLSEQALSGPREHWRPPQRAQMLPAELGADQLLLHRLSVRALSGSILDSCLPLLGGLCIPGASGPESCVRPLAPGRSSPAGTEGVVACRHSLGSWMLGCWLADATGLGLGRASLDAVRVSQWLQADEPGQLSGWLQHEAGLQGADDARQAAQGASPAAAATQCGTHSRQQSAAELAWAAADSLFHSTGHGGGSSSFDTRPMPPQPQRQHRLPFESTPGRRAGAHGAALCSAGSNALPPAAAEAAAEGWQAAREDVPRPPGDYQLVRDLGTPLAAAAPAGPGSVDGSGGGSSHRPTITTDGPSTTATAPTLRQPPIVLSLASPPAPLQFSPALAWAIGPATAASTTAAGPQLQRPAGAAPLPPPALASIAAVACAAQGSQPQPLEGQTASGGLPGGADAAYKRPLLALHEIERMI